MPIRVACACGKQLQAPDSAAGKKVRCPACQAAVPVPAGTVPAPVPPPPAAEKPRPKAPPVEEPPKTSKMPISLDDEPEEADEPAPKKSAKKARRDEDDDERPAKKSRKKRPLWVTLVALGCGGVLLLSCAGGSLIGGFLYYLSAQQDKVVGKWVVDPGATENAALPLLNRTMQVQFDKKDMRCTMRTLGVEFMGKWSVVRNRDNDAILVLVDFDEARGPDGQKVTSGKEKFQSAFEITPVDADHIDLVDSKDRAVRMRMKKVDSFDKVPKT